MTSHIPPYSDLSGPWAPAEDDGQLLSDAFATLTPGVAAVVVLSYFGQLSPAVIATRLGLNQPQVVHLLAVGLRELGRALMTQFDQAEQRSRRPLRAIA